MRVISDSAGFALWFDNPKDLDETIKQLTLLKAEREAKPGKKWPAFLGVFVARPEDSDGEGYGRQLLAWLRDRLAEKTL